jgi:TRAP-type C4-dicarboxylate transport system permease large subunit
VGITLYVACQAGGVPFNKVHKTIWWFVGAMTAVALACAFVPALTTALPNAVFGS